MAFVTYESELLRKVGPQGILQSQLNPTELGVVLKLMDYRYAGRKRPKLMSIHTSQGTRIVPYPGK